MSHVSISTGTIPEAPGQSPAAATVSLRVTGLTKSFGSVRALSDVSFTATAGTIHALLGGNGSGKSTLIKALAGVQQADEGTVEVNGVSILASNLTPGWARSTGLSFVHQNVGVFPDLSVMENFALPSGYKVNPFTGISWTPLRKRIQDILDHFELDVDARTKMGDLRPAIQTMIAVARALHNEGQSDHGILILDEPTASLPADEARQVMLSARNVANRGHTVILVSHRLDEVLDYADDATFLRDGRLLETVAVASLTERSIVQRIAGVDDLPETHDEIVTSFAPYLEVKDLFAGPVRGLNLTVGRGEIVGLAGLLGSGRSSILKSLFGLISTETGTISLNGTPVKFGHPTSAMRLGVAYVPEDRNEEAAFPDLNVEENLSISRLGDYWRAGRFAQRKQNLTASSVIDEYKVVVNSPSSTFSTMSGGNAQKVVMARWLGRTPQLLLIDEPTQGVDVGARADIHRRIVRAARAGMAVIVVSSDSSELAGLCDRVIGISNGTNKGVLVGRGVTLPACAELAHGISEDAPGETERES